MEGQKGEAYISCVLTWQKISSEHAPESIFKDALIYS
jgi:hypothetical protein